MSFPAAFDDAPVGFISVHRGDHASAARGDSVVAAALGIDFRERGFELVDIDERRRRADIAAVEEWVDAQRAHAGSIRMTDHGEQVVDVRMDIAVA